MVRAMAREVPPEFHGGIAAIEVTGKTVPHPTREGVYTLGECVPHAFGGPDDEGPTLRSTVLLHYGSFAALARDQSGFDWRSEAWETLTHELRHHLEWRARTDALEAFDEAVEANYARLEGERFPPLFFLDGERLAPDVYKVEDDVFLDVQLDARAWRRAAGTERVFTWHGRPWRVTLPAELPDVLFLSVEGVEPEPAGELVLVIRRRPRARRRRRGRVLEPGEARAYPAPIS
jgi:hypothetical protein